MYETLCLPLSKVYSYIEPGTGEVKVRLETLTLELVAQTPTRKHHHWGSSCKLEGH